MKVEAGRTTSRLTIRIPNELIPILEKRAQGKSVTCYIQEQIVRALRNVKPDSACAMKPPIYNRLSHKAEC